MKIISWNIAHRKQSWHHLLHSCVDVALLQEASEPPEEVRNKIVVDNEPWETYSSGNNSPWRTAVVKLSNNVKVDFIKPFPIGQDQGRELLVSRLGTISAAQVKYKEEFPIILISMYGFWEKPHKITGSNWLFADASVHRVISDLSTFIGSQTNHRVIASGDLNILYGYGENGSKYWASRYSTVFSRMDALGLKFIGPQVPFGRQANPWPLELPPLSKNVPTHYSTKQSPQAATRQLDYVFASKDIANRVQVTALNQPDQWGPSNHCRIIVEI